MTSQQPPLDNTIGTARAGVRKTPASRKARATNDAKGGHSRLLGWGLIVALLALWELATRVGWVVSPNLPAPSDILLAWRDLLLGSGLTNLAITLMRALAGYGLAILFGIALGMAMGSWSLVDALLEPMVELLRPIPVTALVPLVILFVGIGHELKIILAFAGALFPILINTYAGTRSISSTLRETAMTFRLGTFERIWQIVLPSAAPSIFVGLRLGLAIAFVVTVVAEMIAGNSGLGYFILHSEEMMQMPELYAGVLTLALAGYALNFGFLWIERKVLFWSERIRHGGIA